LLPNIVNAQLPSQLTNLTSQINQSIPSNATSSAWDWLKSIPLKDLYNMLTSGTTGIINWLANGSNGLLTFIFHLFSPNLKVPSWIGWLTVLFIFIAIIWWQWENLWEFMHNIIFWIVLLIIVIIVIAIVLIFLGVLH